MLNILYPTKTVCHFMCEPLQASLYLVGLLWYALRSQLYNLSSMPDSVCMGCGTAIETGSSKRFKWYPTTVEFQVGFSLLWIKAYPGLSLYLVKGSCLETHIWVVGYHLNRLDEPVLMAVPKPMLTEFGIHYRLESCVGRAPNER